MAGGIGQTNYGRLRQRQGTVGSLATADPVPAYGEFLVTYDGDTPVVKMGDGVRSWTELPNLVGGGGGGPSGWRQFTATQDVSLGAQSTSLPAEWVDQGEQGGTVDATPSGYKIEIGTAGWYNFRLNVKQEFLSSYPPALFARITGDSVWQEYRQSAPVTIGGTGNSSAGCQIDLCTGPVPVPAGDLWWARMDWYSADDVAASLRFTLDIVRVG